VAADNTCVFGDLLATKKVVGYASHSDTKFCSFCHAKLPKLPLLQLSRRHEKPKPFLQLATSANQQEQIWKATGVQWSVARMLC
jgi:hypothetical protein